jgi:uncharacterized protein (TIGR02118 family)
MENSVSRLFCATVLYPFKSGTVFDYDCYAHVLIPKYIAVLGDNCVRYEIRKGISTPGKDHVDFFCIANFWIKSLTRLSAAMANPEMQEIMREIAVFTNIIPLRQLDEVIMDFPEHA